MQGPDQDQADPVEVDRAKANLASRTWRLNNLYWIKDKDGKVIQFKPNAVQIALDQSLHNRNLVPKSRQHGITTWACIRALDTALFRAGSASGVVAHNLSDATKFFRDKVLFAYDRLPAWLQAAVPITKRDMNGTLVLGNGSSIEVSTSHRGGTMNFLHISEYGPLCALQPAKAAEVKAGALNTVTADAIVVIESTAYGNTGDFADKVTIAERLEKAISAGTAVLTQMDYKLHFFAWHQDPRNAISAFGVVISPEDKKYFELVEAKCNCKLSPEQRAWYVKKAEEQQDTMTREHPSTLEEAFQSSIEGAYYVLEMAKVRNEGRIKKGIHIAKAVPVDTFWDLGFNDTTAIWFHQYSNLENRFLLAFQESGKSLEFYVEYLRSIAAEKGWSYGTHYLPHDAENDSIQTGESALTRLKRFFPNQDWVVVPRIENVMEGIRQTRTRFASCWFDEDGCAEGLSALDAYRKTWIKHTQSWSNVPRHDQASNFADAFRQFGQGWRTAAARNTAARPVVGRSRSPA